ncbi:MAG TPA: F0F1 ATP synthase subunit alpha, partial [Nitrospirae bacterium]|nr:F0F1 ATP synthase subunit alpha [Nitrospirota bacterium]
GKRMVELLKQNQYVPMTMQDQVIVLFAGTQGYLDDVPVEAIKKFEEEFIKFISGTKDDLRSELAGKKAIDDDLKARLVQAIEEFKKGFQA